MKTFTTMTAAAMLIAGMSLANAQNASGTTEIGSPSPSSLNAAPMRGSDNQSGSETKGTAMMKKDSKPMNAANQSALSPSDPNYKPVESGSLTKSGSQSEKSAMQGDKNARKAMTTGSAESSPSAPNYEPPRQKQ